MSMEIRVPKLPESVADATLVTWRKQPGDAVAREENLADLETDKVVLEVPAPANGILQEIKVQAGTTVKSDDLLAIIVPEATATKPASAPAGAAPVAAAQSLATNKPAAGSVDVAARSGPAARRALAESGADAAKVPASGKDGRVTKGDVADFVSKPAAVTAAPASARVPAALGARSEQRVPMTRLRQRIAERLLQAQHGAALLTTFNEIDMTAVSELRARYKDKFEKEQGVKLGFMSFFVKASIEALKKFPVMNAAIDGTDVVYHEYYDIGVAVSTDRGLVVPVVRNAAQKSFGDIEREIVDYATRARSGTLTLEELTGGTFTITNGGVFGSLLSTPIVNAPQSAILGMHKTQERPMAVGGQIVLRPMMYLAVTYDHRIIDGREAVQFLVCIKECLEDPGRMLLGL